MAASTPGHLLKQAQSAADPNWLMASPSRLEASDETDIGKIAITRGAIKVADGLDKPEVLRACASWGPGPEVEAAIARNLHTDLQTLARLGTIQDLEVNGAVFHNPNTLRRLRKDSWQVRYTVAGNPSTPLDVLGPLPDQPRQLGQLAVDPVAPVRRQVALNPSSPPYLLELLSHGGEAEIRQTVAGRPYCPPEIAEWLLRDRSQIVAAAAARHPILPLERIEELLRYHDDPLIAAGAADNPNCPPYLRAMWQLAHHS